MKKLHVIIFTLLTLSVGILSAKGGTNSFRNNLIMPQNETEDAKPFKKSDGVKVDMYIDSTSFLNKTYPIDDRGYVEFPLLGKVHITNMSKKELKDFIRKNFRNYIRYPDFDVKPMVRVALHGGFQRPGLYYVDINSSLWDIIYDVGGTIREDGIYEMHWERLGDEESEEVTKLFESGISLRAMGFKSGDQIWTPSPDARTIWDTMRDVMPLLTFSTTVWVLYDNYQRSTALLSR